MSVGIKYKLFSTGAREEESKDLPSYGGLAPPHTTPSPPRVLRGVWFLSFPFGMDSPDCPWCDNFPSFPVLHVFSPGLVIYILCHCTEDVDAWLQEQKVQPYWVAGAGGWKGPAWLTLTISYPRAGLTVPRSVSGSISILTLPKARLCALSAVYPTIFIISYFFLCANQMSPPAV